MADLVPLVGAVLAFAVTIYGAGYLAGHIWSSFKTVAEL